MTRYWKNLLMCQRSIWIKVPVTYQWERKSRDKKLKNPKAFIDYSQTIDDVYESLEDYNPSKKRKVLLLFDDMIASTEGNKSWVLL